MQHLGTRGLLAVMVLVLSGCGGGGGGTTAPAAVVSKISVAGLTTNICGADVRIAYPSGVSYSSSVVLNPTQTLINDTPNYAPNAVLITRVDAPQGGGFTNGEILQATFSISQGTPQISAFRVYSSLIYDCTGAPQDWSNFQLNTVIQ